MDRLKIEISEDGEIIVTTPGISAKNHGAADEFLKILESLTGTPKTKKLRHGHAHTVNGQTIHHHH